MFPTVRSLLILGTFLFLSAIPLAAQQYSPCTIRTETDIPNCACGRTCILELANDVTVTDPNIDMLQYLVRLNGFSLNFEVSPKITHELKFEGPGTVQLEDYIAISEKRGGTITIDQLNQGIVDCDCDNLLDAFRYVVVEPVIWAYFKGEVAMGTTYLYWGTNQEINSRFFELQISEDGENFRRFLSFEAGGNSHELREYEASFKLKDKKLSYYRIGMVDEAGDAYFSEVLFLPQKGNNFADVGNGSGAVFPTRSHNQITVKTIKNGEVKLLNPFGQVLRNWDQMAGDQVNVDVSTLPTGIYYLVQANTQIELLGKFFKN